MCCNFLNFTLNMTCSFTGVYCCGWDVSCRRDQRNESNEGSETAAYVKLLRIASVHSEEDYLLSVNLVWYCGYWHVTWRNVHQTLLYDSKVALHYFQHSICRWLNLFKTISIVLDLELYACFECHMLSSGWFTSVCSLNVRISGH
jgi:hypothetical protein